MHSARRQSDNDVACGNIAARQDFIAPHSADRKSSEIVIASLIDSRHFRGFAADQCASSFAAGPGNALDHRGADCRIEFSAGEIIEKEQWFRALHHKIVDGHRDKIEADRVMTRCLDRDLDLGADAVGRRDQNRIDKTGGFQIEQATEAPDFGCGAGTRGRAHQWLDQVHHAVAGIDVDPGGRVASVFHEITNADRRTRLGTAGCRGLLRRNRRVCKRAGAAILGAGIAPGTADSLVRRGFAQRRWRGEGVARALRQAGGGLSIPNLITLGRILLVPIVVWAITLGEMRVAFALFLAAGISDAVDGFLAKRFHMKSELGAYLDPLADKALIVSIYVSLGIVGMVPIFLVILVVSRDIMIVSAFLLAWLVGRPMPVRPLLVSKVNTVAQILLAVLILAEHAFGLDFGFVSRVTMAAVALLTLLSIAFYLREWVRHMNSFGAGH